MRPCLEGCSEKRTEVGTAFITSARPHHPRCHHHNRQGVLGGKQVVGSGGRDECGPYLGFPLFSHNYLHKTTRKTSIVHTYSMAEIRERITRLPEQFAQEFQTEGEIEAVTATRHGKPVLAILLWDLYESIIETMEILGDQEQMAALGKGIQALERGETVSSEDVKARLGL